MRAVRIIARRELGAYFSAPLAYVFIVIFLALSGAMTFHVGGFLERGQADLAPFFGFHPWLYLFLIPAIGMRLWAEERKAGTLEFLMTLPVPAVAAVTGKFLAAWLFAGIALALTFPLWITVNVLGDPDNGVIVAAYAGSWLMAGGMLAISACVSALTRNQVVAFTVAATLCFLFMMSGLELVQAFFRDWLPDLLVLSIARLSILANYQAMSQGVIDLREVFFFVSLIAVGLFVNTALVELKKGA